MGYIEENATKCYDMNNKSHGGALWTIIYVVNFSEREWLNYVKKW